MKLTHGDLNLQHSIDLIQNRAVTAETGRLISDRSDDIENRLLKMFLFKDRVEILPMKGFHFI